VSEKFVILVVDDNANNRFTLRALLRNLPDCETLEADSGESALIQTIEHSIHLILLDVQMPVMDGFETARHLQMTERTRHIPIVFVTAVFKSEEFIQRGYGIGAVDYLTKPIDDNLLLNRVKLYQRVFSHQRELERTIALLQMREQELLRLKNTAEAASRAKSIFLANMSHELRTPLNAILGFSQLLEHDTQLSEQHKTEVSTINRAGQHLLALINDVLEISRIEAGRTTLHNQSFNLTETLSTVEEMMRSRAEAKGLRFRVEYNQPLPRYVLGDANRLRQVLINLLGNAVKFTEQGEVVLKLNVSNNERIDFAITDTGAGISPEEQHRLFHAFYQTDVGIAKGDGSGLGLIISREFVRLMGSDINLSSQVGQGSTFSFSLPLPKAAAPAAVLTARRVLSLAVDQPPVRILVAEDDADSRALISRLLENAGFQVRTVKNGQEAIAIFQIWQPHFIWMDMRMPVIDGYQATQQIRALAGGDKVKIAALTASVFKEELSDILTAGCNEIVFKPLAEARLFEVMGQLLNLDYTYESNVQTPAEIEDTMPNLKLLPEPLQAELKAAADQLDTEAIHNITEKMQAYPAHAQIINSWVDAFRFDTLLRALKK
jgi:signal transduction histidine kinase